MLKSVSSLRSVSALGFALIVLGGCVGHEGLRQATGGLYAGRFLGDSEQVQPQYRAFADELERQISEAEGASAGLLERADAQSEEARAGLTKFQTEKGVIVSALQMGAAPRDEALRQRLESAQRHLMGVESLTAQLARVEQDAQAMANDLTDLAIASRAASALPDADSEDYQVLRALRVRALMAAVPLQVLADELRQRGSHLAPAVQTERAELGQLAAGIGRGGLVAAAPATPRAPALNYRTSPPRTQPPASVRSYVPQGQAQSGQTQLRAAPPPVPQTPALDYSLRAPATQPPASVRAYVPQAQAPAAPQARGASPYAPTQSPALTRPLTPTPAQPPSSLRGFVERAPTPPFVPTDGPSPRPSPPRAPLVPAAADARALGPAFVIIRFRDPQTPFRAALAQAIEEAQRRCPTSEYTVAALTPFGGDATAAQQYGQTVNLSLQRLQIERARIQMAPPRLAAVAMPEVHVYLR